MSINAVDVLLVVVVVLVVLNGYRRGFILGFLDLLGWTFCLLAALRFYRPVSHWLTTYFQPWPDVWTRPIAFVMVGVLATVVVQLIGGALLSRVSERVHESQTNRFFGIIPGFVNGLITAALLSALLLTLPLSEGIRERARDSALVNRLAGYTERLEAALQPVFSEAIAETLNMLTVQPQSHERVDLPYKVPVSRPRPDLEAAMLQLVNKERIAAGLKPLAADPELTEVARKHSADMFARGYFAHDTPEGRDPFERMREAGVRFTTAGENLALAPSVRVAHTGLMNSPGHRANILQKDFGRLGIGIMDGGVRGIMVSQEFRN
jgi:uncharacterized protein YkwD